MPCTPRRDSRRWLHVASLQILASKPDEIVRLLKNQENLLLQEGGKNDGTRPRALP